MFGRPRPIGPHDDPLLDPARHRSVRIVLLSGIGDVVHGLPLANDIKRLNPELTVDWVAEQAPAEVLRNHPAVDRIVVFPKGSGWRGLRALRRELSERPADITINAQRYLKSAWPTLLNPSRLRVGLPPSKTRDGIDFAHTHALVETPWKHTQELFLDFRWALGVRRDLEPEWGLSFSRTELRLAEALFSDLDDRPRVGLVLASANPEKDWPAERYRVLAEALERDLDARVLLIGGPSAVERKVAEEVMAPPGLGVMDFLGDDVRQMMWMIAGCDLLISPDTGPLHVAHALNVPVIGLFGHTNPWRVGPYARFHELVIDRYTDPGEDPDPSGYVPKYGRMGLISVDDVLQKVEVARSRER